MGYDRSDPDDNASDATFDDSDYDKISELYSHIWYGNGEGTSDANRYIALHMFSLSSKTVKGTPDFCKKSLFVVQMTPTSESIGQILVSFWGN